MQPDQDETPNQPNSNNVPPQNNPYNQPQQNPTPSVNPQAPLQPIQQPQPAQPMQQATLVQSTFAPQQNQTLEPNHISGNSQAPLVFAPTQPEHNTTGASSIQTPMQPAQIPTMQSTSSIPEAQTPFTPQPAVPVNTYATPTGSGPLPSLNQKKSMKPFIFASVFASLLILAGTAAYVFGIYIPNKPENVWSTGLSRTGQEAQAVVDKITDPEAFNSLSKNKLMVAGEVNTNDGKFKFNLDSAFDQTKSDSNLSFDASAGAATDQNINLQAKVKTNIQEDSVFPNVYFQISGFSALGLDSFIPGINDYESKWIAVEQDFYKDTISDLGDVEENDISNVTQQDIVSIIDDVVGVSQDYIFTTDSERAVIVLEEFIATEESEGITANHYKASIDLEKATAFCIAVSDKLINDNQAFRKIEGIKDSNIDEKRESAKKDCTYDDQEESREELEKPFDIWMDNKHKIFHKVRFYEDLEKKNNKTKESKASCLQRYAEFDNRRDTSTYCDYYDDQIEEGEKYVEFGQIYDGNDSIMLFASQKNDTNNKNDYLRADLTIDINNLTYNGVIAYADTTDENKTANAKVTISTEPYTEEINADRPESAANLQDVIDDLNSRSRAQQSFGPQELGLNTEENNEALLEAEINDNEEQTTYDVVIDFLQNFLIAP